jgi:hypothetical protein
MGIMAKRAPKQAAGGGGGKFFTALFGFRILNSELPDF